MALWLPAGKTELALPQLHGEVIPARWSCAGISGLSLLYFQKPTAIKALQNSALEDKIDMSAAGDLCQREVGSCLHKDTTATQTHWTSCSANGWVPRKSLDTASCSPSTPRSRSASITFRCSGPDSKPWAKPSPSIEMLLVIKEQDCSSPSPWEGSRACTGAGGHFHLTRISKLCLQSRAFFCKGAGGALGTVRCSHLSPPSALLFLERSQGHLTSHMTAQLLDGRFSWKALVQVKQGLSPPKGHQVERSVSSHTTSLVLSTRLKLYVTIKCNYQEN